MSTRQVRQRIPCPAFSPRDALLLAAVLAGLGTQATAQQQFAELGKRHLPFDRHDTRAVAAADVDADGDLDLIVAASGQDRLYRNDGSGIYTDVTAGGMPADSGAVSVAVGDVDGDGKVDLVLGGPGRPLLYLNNGAGGFADATASNLPSATPFPISAVALGDVDGDGDLDLVAGSAGSCSYTSCANGQTRLYLNQGGVFTDATGQLPWNDSDSTAAIALGDVDGIHGLDILVGNSGQHRLYLNNGAGTFADASLTWMSSSGFQNALAVALGDVDGDGDLDVVFANYARQNRLYLNNGATFVDATGNLPPDADNTTGILLGDLDGDGFADIVCGNDGVFGGQDRIYLNDASGRFHDRTSSWLPPLQDHTAAICLADVDGDGDRDLIVGSPRDDSGPSRSQDRLYLNSTGTFADATASALPSDRMNLSSLLVGDVDGDGDVDLVVGNNGLNRIYVQDRAASAFADETALRLPAISAETNALALGDVDGDGHPDLVVADGSIGVGGGRQNQLCLNNGSGVFADATAGRLPVSLDNTTSVALGDIDGDGDRDIVFGNSNLGFGSPRNRMYLNDGTGTFTNVTGTLLPVDSDFTNAVVLADFDGDHRLDLVTGNDGTQNRLYLNTGSGGLIDMTLGHMPADTDATTSIAVGDVDGDGDLDLVLGTSRGDLGQNDRLYLNNGSAVFTDVTASHMPTGSDRAVALADVDEDGDLDLVTGSQLLLNDGSGHFSDASAMLQFDSFPWAIALADVDGDGDLDVVAGQVNTGARIFSNLLRQLDSPYLARTGNDYRLDVYARYGTGRLFDAAVVGISDTRVSVPLPPLGTLGLDLNRTTLLPAFLIPQPQGVATLTLPVPNNPAFAGLTIYAQSLLVQYPVQDPLTNVVADRILGP